MGVIGSWRDLEGVRKSRDRDRENVYLRTMITIKINRDLA